MTHTILLFNNKHWQFIIFLVKNCWLVNWTIYSLSCSLFCYLNIFQFLCVCRSNKTIQSCVLHKLKLALDYIRCNWHKVFSLKVLSLVQEWPFVARVFSLGFHGEREEGRGTVRQMFSLQPSVWDYTRPLGCSPPPSLRRVFHGQNPTERRPDAYRALFSRCCCSPQAEMWWCGVIVRLWYSSFRLHVHSLHEMWSDIGGAQI